MAAEIVRRYWQLAAAGFCAAGASTATCALDLAHAPQTVMATGAVSTLPAMTFREAAQRAPVIADMTVASAPSSASASAPEVAQDSNTLAAATWALLGGQSSVPENNQALSLAGGLLAIGMVLLRRGRLAS